MDEVLSRDFDLHFPNDSDEHLFMCLLCIFFGETSVKGLCQFLNWVVCAFVNEL